MIVEPRGKLCEIQEIVKKAGRKFLKNRLQGSGLNLVKGRDEISLLKGVKGHAKDARFFEC
jgi:hypothetical protein